MSRYSRPPVELISQVGSDDRLPHNQPTQHRVRIRNLGLKDIWARFISRCGDDSIRYVASPDETKWEPHHVRLRDCDNPEREFLFADAAGVLEASPPAGRMTQLLLTARSQPASPTALVPAPMRWREPLCDVPANVTIV